MQSTGGSDPITVVLADDHTVVRSALRKLLEDEAGIEVVAEAGRRRCGDPLRQRATGPRC